MPRKHSKQDVLLERKFLVFAKIVLQKYNTMYVIWGKKSTSIRPVTKEGCLVAKQVCSRLRNISYDRRTCNQFTFEDMQVASS